jgi:hypothetical protein
MSPEVAHSFLVYRMAQEDSPYFPSLEDRDFATAVSTRHVGSWGAGIAMALSGGSA